MADISGKPNRNAHVRLATILDIIVELGGARVGYLSRLLQVSTATIRADLRKLENLQNVIRVRGGVLSYQSDGNSADFRRKYLAFSASSIVFARAAASLVGEGETIILDGDFTGKQIVNYLSKFRQINILTNDLGLAVFSSRHQNLFVVVPGGIRPAESSRLIGPFAENNIHRLSADKYFLHATSIDPERGVLGFGNESAQLTRHLASIAREVIVIAGRDAFFSDGSIPIWPMDRISTIITDLPLRTENSIKLTRPGITVIRI